MKHKKKRPWKTWKCFVDLNRLLLLGELLLLREAEMQVVQVTVAQQQPWSSKLSSCNKSANLKFNILFSSLKNPESIRRITVRGRLKTFKSRYHLRSNSVGRVHGTTGIHKSRGTAFWGHTLSHLSPSLQVTGENPTIYKFKPLKSGRLEK